MSAMLGMMLRGFGMGDAADFLTSGEGQQAALTVVSELGEMRRDVAIIYQALLRQGFITDADIQAGCARCADLPGLQLSFRNRADGTGMPAVAGSAPDIGNGRHPDALDGD